MLKKVWNFFCSVKLTVVLFVLILFPSVAGTLVQQNADDPTSYIKAYGPLWNSIFKWLGFYDIYHDWRFIILLALLALNTFACTANRFRPKWSMAGMLMTHVGLLMIMLGALMGATLGVKGFMAIGEGETLDSIMVGRATRDVEPLGFKVKLLDFILDMHEEPSKKLYVIDMKTGKQHGRKIEEGKEIALVEPRWSGFLSLFGAKPKPLASVTAERFLSGATTVTSLSEGPEQTGMKALEITLRNSQVEQRGFAVSGSGHPYSPRGSHLGVYYEKLADKDELEGAIERAVASTQEVTRLEITLPDSKLVRTFSAEIGARFEVEDYTVESLRYEPDFLILGEGRFGSRTQLPHNPALQVKITGPEGSSEQWLFAKFPDMHQSEDGPPFKIKFVREDSGQHVVDHVFILRTPEETVVVAHARGGKLIGRTETEVGGAVPIEGVGSEIVVDKFYENGNVLREIKEAPGSQGGTPAVEIVLEQGGERSTHLLRENAPLDVTGYRLVYVLEERIRDFYSVLQIIDGGEVALEKKIEVNDPLRYGGYALYQSSYDSEGLSWSGLQVRKDPGVPLVYAGFAIQILGMIVIFYVNPLIRKAKKARA